MATETEPTSEAPAPPEPPKIGIPKKTLIWVGVIVAVVWAFTIHTGSTWLFYVVLVLTILLATVLAWAFRMVGKQKKLVGVLQGAASSPEARREALAKLNEGKDANAPTNLFARAQLMAPDDPKAALKLLEPIDLKTFPAAMQDDVSLLKAQLYLGIGRTQDARKAADTINLDNPERKQMRAYSAAIVAEAWARTGKPKEALALIDTVELPSKASDAEQISVQLRVARIFARFAANQRGPARNELVALASDDVNYLGRFLDPRFRVHPELQKLARQVLEQNPAARKMAKSQAKTQAKR